MLTGKSIIDLKPENPNTDLVIVIEDDVEIVEEEWVSSDIINIYYFAPDAVIKKVKNMRNFSINMKEDLSIGDRVRHDTLNLEDKTRLGFERITEELYHPDKGDLEGILSSLVSASRTKILSRSL